MKLHGNRLLRRSEAGWRGSDTRADSKKHARTHRKLLEINAFLTEIPGKFGKTLIRKLRLTHYLSSQREKCGNKIVKREALTPSTVKSW